MPKINQEEYEVFKSKSPQWNWIARNEDNRLFVYIGEPIKDNLEWDVSGFGRHWLFEMDNLFQFIQWEDEEPYNIAELIAEYDTYIAASRTKVLSDTLWAQIKEEETEVKDIESLKRSFENDLKWYSGVNNLVFIAKAEVFEYVLDKLNELDEPEALSQERIDENSTLGQFITNKVINFDKFVKADKLKNLIVPKQEQQKVPKWFDEWCKGRVWGDKFHEGGRFTRSDVRALVQIADGESLHGLTQEQSDEISRDFFKYLDAFHYGYEVEEEQKYVVKLPMSKNNDNQYAIVDYSGNIWIDALPSKYKLTEEEIRGLTKGDVLFEHFAVKVEELEE